MGMVPVELRALLELGVAERLLVIVESEETVADQSHQGLVRLGLI